MKAILLTFFATTTAVAIAASLFLNTILGTFGFAVTSLDTLKNLKASQQIVEKMKKKHRQNKRKAIKKIAKRSTKKVASTVLAAATVGTVGVAVTMIFLEIDDYCKEKQELQENANILYGTQAKFNFKKCFEEGQEDSKAILNELKNSSVKGVATAFDNTSQYSAEKWAKIKEASIKALQSTGGSTGRLWDTAKSWLVK